MSIIRSKFKQHVAQTSPSPLGLEIVKAEGIYLFDPHGKRYMDLISGISVSSLGHGNPEIIQAVKRQSEQFMHTMVYGEHVVAPQVELASLLCDLLPSDLNNVYFVNSGSEAVEGALKLAKRHTGRYRFAAFENAYHGSTHGALSLMDNEYYKSPYHPLIPGISFLRLNDFSSLELLNEDFAAVIIESVQGEAGVRIPSPEFLKALRVQCDRYGILLILDEIQTGIGRTGTLFAFESLGIIPDILLLAKAFGGGLPLGAFIANREIMHKLSFDPILGHITTFGGHPVCCAAGLAAIKYLLSEKLMDSVTEKEAQFVQELKHPLIREIRSKGLLLAVDMDDEDLVIKMVDEAKNAGILFDWFLYDQKSIRLAPPLTISSSQIAEACKTLLNIFDQF